MLAATGTEHEQRGAQEQDQAKIGGMSRYGRAFGENIPGDAFLDDFAVNSVAAIALHHALQY